MKVSIRSLVFGSLSLVSIFLSTFFIIFLNYSYEKENLLIFEHEVDVMHLQVKSKIDLYFENIFESLAFADHIKKYDVSCFFDTRNEVKNIYFDNSSIIESGYRNIKDFKFSLFYTFSNFKRINILIDFSDIIKKEFENHNITLISENDDLDVEIKEKFSEYLKSNKKSFHNKSLKKSVHFFKLSQGVHICSQHSTHDLFADIQKNQKQNFFYLLIFLFFMLIFSLIIAAYIRFSILKLMDIISDIKEFNLVPCPSKDEFEEIETLNNMVNEVKAMLISFKKFVPVEIVKKLMESGKVVQCSGQSHESTIMFSDIRSFTTLSEKIDANDLFDFMHSYFELVYDVIVKFNGNIDKSIGDSVMAIWNAPTLVEDHAYLACCAALKCCDLLKKANLKHKIDTNFGINTGVVAVGTIGSNERLQYSALGDNVNIASRLEALNKVYGTSILISEFTYKIVKDKLPCRVVDCVLLKGKLKEILVYELLAENINNLKIIELSAHAFNLMQEKKYKEALAVYNKLLAINKNDSVAKLMIMKVNKIDV